MKTTIGYFKYMLMALTAVFAFSACSDDDDDKANSAAVIEVITPAEKQITCNGEIEDNDENFPFAVTFKASNNWTAIPSHKWINLSKMTGSAGENTIFVIVENNEVFQRRIGTITLKDKVSGNSVDILVTQGEKGSVLTFSTPEPKTSLVLNNEEETITAEVDVKSNYEYSLSVSADWLTYEKKGKNDDGSEKYIFHANPEKLFATGGYNAQTAIVSFSYTSVTRTPATKEYAVKFDGITPFATFFSGMDEINKANLEDMFGEGTYQSVIRVKSNVAWTLKDASDYAKSEIVGTEQSVNFFEKTVSVAVTLKDGKLDTEDLGDGKLEIVNANTQEVVGELPVWVNGVGADYIQIDRSSFIVGVDQEIGVYLFDAEGSNLEFKVNASNLDDVVFYMAKVQEMMGYPSQIVGMDVGPEGYGGFVNVTEAPVTRSAVESGKFILTTTARNEQESWMGGNPAQNRFFALFAVSKAKYPTFDDLFYTDEETYMPMLKEELEGKYIRLGQKGLEIKYTFESETIPYDDYVINLPAEGGEVKVEYTTTAQYISSVYLNLNWEDKSDPYSFTGDWLEEGGDLSIDWGDYYSYFIIKVKPTTETRTFKCGIATYVQSKGTDYLMRSFTIRQTAE